MSTANPRRMCRDRRLIGPEIATAMNAAMTIHVSGLRSR